MNRTLMLSLIALSLLSACMVAPAGRHGYRQDSVVLVPLLPPVVVLDIEPYYFYSGFHYHYNNGRWFYSRSKNGPWADLPRDHYPKEVRYKGKEKRRDDDHGRHDRDQENRHR